MIAVGGVFNPKSEVREVDWLGLEEFGESALLKVVGEGLRHLFWNVAGADLGEGDFNGVFESSRNALVDENFMGVEIGEH